MSNSLGELLKQALIPQYGGRTILADEDEGKFLKWYLPLAQKIGINPNPDDPQHFYDYRGFWKAMKVGKAARGFDPESQEVHFPSTYKLPGHPSYFKKYQR